MLSSAVNSSKDTARGWQKKCQRIILACRPKQRSNSSIVQQQPAAEDPYPPSHHQLLLDLATGRIAPTADDGQLATPTIPTTPLLLNLKIIKKGYKFFFLLLKKGCFFLFFVGGFFFLRTSLLGAGRMTNFRKSMNLSMNGHHLLDLAAGKMER